MEMGTLKKTQVIGIFLSVLLIIIISGCTSDDEGDNNGNTNSSPDEKLYLNSGANSMSSSEIDLTDYMNSTQMKIKITLDKEESSEEHVFYLYLFEGAPPPTMNVDIDDIHTTLADGAVETFTMTWDEDEIIWERGIYPEITDYYTLTLWNPDRDDYNDTTPNAHVVVRIYFSEGGERDDDDKPDNITFREYDLSDWSENNEDAAPLSALEMCDLLNSHMDEISPGGRITAFTTGGFTGTGLDSNTGKCPGWQVYVLRPEGGEFMSKTINIAENGWTIVYDDHKVMEYPEWDHDSTTIDTTDLKDIVEANETAVDWFAENPNAKLTIQSYHGPPIDSEETSYILKYKAGENELNIYISAEDGRIIEIEDPNDWGWSW